MAGGGIELRRQILSTVLRYLWDQADVDDLVGDQLLPLIEGGDGHGSVFGIGAMHRGRCLAQVLLSAPHRIVRLAGPLGPAVAVGVECDASDAQALATLFELGGPIAGSDGAEVREQRPFGRPALEYLRDLRAELDHGWFEAVVLLHPLEHLLPVIADEPVIPVDVLVGQISDIALGAGEEPAQLVEVPALLVLLPRDDELVFLLGDPALGLVADLGELLLPQDGPGEPAHVEREVLGPAQEYVRADRSPLHHG